MLAAAPSKVPFYIAGGALACWAVLLAFWGIRHHGFPGSARGGRLVMLMSAVLVVCTMTAAVLTGGEGEEAAAGESGGGEGAPAATSRTLALAADPSGALAYDKKSAAVLAGQVTIDFTNDSAVPHNVTIVEGSREIGAGKTISDAKDSLKVQLPAGEYTFFCSVPGHRQAGMEGTLTAE
jgi:plastocyanin